MNANDRTERIVRAWLAESVEPPRVPEYLPDLVTLTARTSQRPAWTLPERWIPMATLTRVEAGLRPVPWRPIAVLALLLLLLAAAVAFYAGRPAPLPAPFGPAANGLVAYAQGGDIFTVDPRSGRSTALTSGPAADSDPVFSRDGTRIAFKSADNGRRSMVVVDTAGADRIVLDSPLLTTDVIGGFTADGGSLLVVGQTGRGSTALAEASLDGSSGRIITEGMELLELPTPLPPDGQQIVFSGAAPGQPSGLYIVDRAGGKPRALVPPMAEESIGLPAVSPDGRRVAFTMWRDAPTMTARLRIVTVADGSVVEPAMPPGVVWQGTFDWSNDGQSIVVGRGYTGTFEDSVLAILPVDDLSSPGVETPRGLAIQGDCCASVKWAPDDSVILVTPVDPLGAHAPQVLVDPATGSVSPAAWTTNSPATWQRRAP